MTTATWSSRVRHDDNPTYQEWRDEFITKLATLVAAGKLAADETSITPGAGARPGASTEGGYAVYHLADSLHGTAPIYIRFGFGTNSTTTAPRIQVTVGTSTNGAGVLGGTALATIASIGGNATQVTDTVRSSYMCAVAGFFGLSWKQAAGNSESSFFLARTVDSAGAITVTGAIAVWGAATSANVTKTQAFRYPSTAIAYTARTALPDTALGFSPQIPSATLVGSNIQAFVAWTITPQMAPVLGICGVLDAEVANATTFSATMVGSTSHTYIGLTLNAGPFGTGAATGGQPKFAMLWE